ncbi:Uncharacterised protein [Candidatus Bilamarchaeum dharawalense]|uniref:Protein kinase domain-containing protein n=1 Tax=Candidatus Bilamarchaeum dharawalense TaxID=2885759 RepID=A0A5E4LPC4_9ARCH|nr:Uncharacterised protein [Candidatus Bilamarchaeum dharawalense]
MATVLRYSPDELKTIREYFGGKRPVKMPDQALAESIRRENPGLVPFLRMSDEKDLFAKLQSDPRIRKFSFVMFFPVLEGHLDSDLREVTISIGPTRTRGFAARILVDDRDMIIKPIQSPDEPKIAKFAGEQGIGPLQYETIEHFLTEEFLPGSPFSQISSNMNDVAARVIGSRVADILTILHKAGIVFNDVILDDDMGGSHLLIDPANGIKLIDFGVSLDLTAFPNLTDEQVYRVLLTMPGIGALIQSGMIGDTALEVEIARMKEEIGIKPIRELLFTDVRFVHEGVGITSMKNNMAAQAIWRAFEAKYHME